MSNIQEEIWKDVVGYEGLYQASDHGNIKSLQPRWKEARILKIKPNRYCFAALVKEKKTTHIGVHRIVLFTFCYRDDYKSLYVNHKNGIKTDNRLENLEWCTAKENTQHAFKTGLIKNRSRANAIHAKLNDVKVREIRKMLSSGIKHQDIANKYAVQRNLISGISRGERWKHVVIIIFCLLFYSCSPASKLRRAKKLISQAEASGLIWKSDTIFKNIEIIVPETKFDTVIRRVDFRDTILITKDKVVTRVKINTVSRDVFVETKCPEKIVVKKVPFTVTREIQVGDRFWTDFKEAIIWLVIGFAVCFVLKTLRVI